ncbi:MAG: hypothetical protein EBX41_06180, partial [Chitinophagia bacterium]|nr:hypothetical protein [Chitinophagia bacterium]
MQRLFIKNILFTLLINILVKPVWVFMIDRVVQNRVPAEEYGSYQALLNLCIIFQILLDFGISGYNTKRVSENHGAVKTLFPQMLSARLVLIIVYVVVTLLSALLLGYKTADIYMLAGIIAMQSMASMVGFLRSNVAALQHYKSDAVLSVADKLLMLVICGILLYTPLTKGSFYISWFIVAQLVAYLATAIGAYWLIVAVTKISEWHKPDWSEVGKVIKGSLPYALLIFLMSIYNRADAMLLERIEGKPAAAVWASGFRLLDIANISGLMFAGLLLPLFGNLLAQKQPVAPVVKLSVNVLLPVSIVITIAGVYYSLPIMQWLYKGASGINEGKIYANVFAVLMLSFPAWCIMYVYSTLLTAAGSLTTLNRIAFVGVLFNITMNIVLIISYHIIGAAITSTATQWLMALLFTYFTKREFAMPYNAVWLAK